MENGKNISTINIMSRKIYVLSLDPNETTIDSPENNVPTNLQNIFIEMFSEAVNNPFSLQKSLQTVKNFYELQISDQTAQFLSIDTTSVTNPNAKTVIQLNMDGTEILSSTAASFGLNKDDVKNNLGSVEKASNNEILVADSENKRVIIIDTVTGKTKWEFMSDRYVLDAHWFPYEIKISITNNMEDYTIMEEQVINIFQNVTWINNTSSLITIYSGDVTEDSFDDNFNINIYGTQFKSSTIEPGKSFSYNFKTEGSYGWFSYPQIVIGSLYVSNSKLSPNDYFLITEGDGLESAFTGRVYKVDVWGNEIWNFGRGYLVHPKDARIANNNVLISI